MPDATETFEEMNARRNRVLEQSTIREITGVVSASGAGGVGTNTKDVWSLGFSFACWKFEEGEIQTLPLYVRKEVLHSDLRVLMQRIRAYDVLRIQARYAAGILPNRAEALLIDLIGSVEFDQQLNRFAQDLQKPVTFDDNQFGKFTLDRRINWFSAETVWDSTPVKLVLHVENDLDHAPPLRIARLLWDMQPEWTEKVFAFAVFKYLEIKNSAWLEKSEEPVSAEEFRHRMKLKTIAAYPSGDVEFWFDDGDLFWGHDILVEGNLSEGPTEAKLAG